MKKKLILLGAALALLLAVSVTSVANEVHFSQETVYIPECGNATVEVLMNATNSTDTWSTRVEFDSVCVNITEVDFSGSITPTYASWGHHGDYVYLGGTNLTASSDNELLLATLTVECNGSSGGPVDLAFTGDEEVERLIAGPPDDAPPRNGTIHSAMWTNGSAQCVGRGDVDCDKDVTVDDVVDIYKHVSNPTYPLYLPWAADVDYCDGEITVDDVVDIYKHVSNPTYKLHCCC